MTMILQMCPSCGAPEAALTIERAVLVGGVSKATCNQCGWTGDLGDVPVAAVPGQEEGIEALAMDIADTVLRALGGPLCACLERRGLLPTPVVPVRGLNAVDGVSEPEVRARRHDDYLNKVRGEIISAITVAVVEISITKCGEHMTELRSRDPRIVPQ